MFPKIRTQRIPQCKPNVAQGECLGNKQTPQPPGHTFPPTRVAMHGKHMGGRSAYREGQ